MNALDELRGSVAAIQPPAQAREAARQSLARAIAAPVRPRRSTWWRRLLIGGAALTLTGAGIGSAAALGAFDNGNGAYVTKAQPGVGHVTYVPVLTSDQAKSLDKLAWALIGTRDDRGTVVFAAITPICSRVDGATVTTTGSTITLAYYGRSIKSCSTEQLLTQQYAVKLPTPLGTRRITGMIAGR